MSTEELKVNIPTFQLNNGLKIPAVGYGTWLGFDEKCQILFEDLPKFVEALSCINYYEYCIVSQCKSLATQPSDVQASVRDSLQRMGLDYIDLLMHWPMSISEDGVDEKIDYLETWSGFESVLKKGLVKSIGVSNFTAEQIERLLKNCQIQPVVNQIELHINLGQKELVSYCQKNDIICVGYTPLGGMMSERYDPNNKGTKVDNPKLMSIARKYGKSVAQVVLRYMHERGLVSIPKSITNSRIIENASIFDFKLDAKDFAVLDEFDHNYRTLIPIPLQNYDNYPFEKIDNVDIPEIPLVLLKWKNRAKIDI